LLLDDVWNKVCTSIRFEFCGKRGKENLLQSIILQVPATDKDAVVPQGHDFCFECVRVGPSFTSSSDPSTRVLKL